MTRVHDEIGDDLDATRARLAGIADTFQIADFARLLSKFFAGIMLLERAFEQRFPQEYAAWAKEFYGEDC